MRLVVSAVLCIISIFVGSRIYSIYKGENDFILEWDKFNKYLISEIQFNKNSIDVIVDNYKVTQSKKFGNLLKEFISYINTYKNMDNMGELVKNNIIVKYEYKRVLSYFSNIGNMDYMSQINYLKSISNEINEAKNIATKNLKSKGALSLKLSLILGIAIMILFI